MADLRRVAFLRLDAIAYGAVMAAISLYRPQWIARPRMLLCIGAVLVLALWGNALKLVVSPHLAAVLMLNVSSLGLVLFLPAAVQVQHAPRWFAAPMRTIAAQSYGLYIMHLTFVDLAFWVNGTWPWINKPTAWLGSLVIPFVLSWLSFRYFETPILRMRPSQRLKPVVTRDGVVGLDQRVYSVGGAPSAAQPAVIGANRD
jgi:peptidoglycan/LPS O-acetylase OafA/YrhL